MTQDKHKGVLHEVRKCHKKHKPEIVISDLSKAYRNEKYKKMYSIRCDVKGTCEFSDFYFKKSDAIRGWNTGEIL